MYRKVRVYIYAVFVLSLLSLAGCVNGEGVLVPETGMPTQQVTASVSTDINVTPEAPVITPSVSGDASGAETPIPTEQAGNVVALNTPTPVPTEDPRVILTFAGDMCLSENYFPYITYVAGGYDVYSCISEEFINEMRNSSLCFVNSEFPFTDSDNKLKGKLYNFKVNPATVKFYADLGVDIAGLANNHVYDYGEESLLDTMETLKEAGISYVGAGKNIQEAETPLYFTVNGIKIAYVMASKAEKNRKTPEAGESAGILLCYDSDRFCNSISEAEKNADYVVAVVHWGKENSDALESDQYSLGSEYIDAGADIVVGGHSHVIQGVDYYKGKPIFYSLGDFWFDYYTEDTFLLKLYLERNDDGSIDASAQVIPGVQKEGFTGACDSEYDKSRILQKLNSLSESGVIDNEGYVHDAKDFDISSISFTDYDMPFRGVTEVSRGLNEAEIGHTVQFGSYASEPLKWYVVNKNGNELTLLAKNIVEEKSFDEDSRNVSWNDCSLRSWLNNDFLNTAFSGDEKAMLSEINGDYVRVPSSKEIYTILEKLNVEYMMAAPTKYAYKLGIYTYNPLDHVIKCTDWGSSGYSETAFGCWWLSDNGPLQGTAAFVNEFGNVMATGMFTGAYSYSDGLCGVRPMIKIKY